eukprot:TRINITY_DN28451_c0_g1_i1.p1 TRINITY_DN28451_c0_g1~~TRINITY_DN28451_c0_g1_i1.p1  ORF type:complete len:261 (+),score=45.88 TRINITY_DN28451_c0_g1_i1:64-846(+)
MGNSQCFAPLGAPAALPALKQPPPKLTIGFWDFRGLGAPMRMMCVYAGAEHEDVKYTAKKKSKGGWIAPEWERRDKPGLMERNPLINLPYVVNHSTGEVVAQSNAVYLYLGRVCGLHGSTRDEELANEQVLSHMHSMWMEHRDLVYPFKSGDPELMFVEALKDHFGQKLPLNYEKLEAWLIQRGGCFMAGRQPCTADFHVFEMLDQQEALASQNGYASPLEQFEVLRAYFERFRALPKLQSYFNGPDYKLPYQGRMALFK